MNSRELYSAVVIKTDTCLLEIKEMKKMMQDLSFKVNTLVPQSHLQPFSKPSQKLVGRDLNVANWFRSKTASENGKLPTNAPRKYLEFPAGMSDEQLNEDMKRCVHGIMCERLRPGWETKSWNVIYCEDKRTGEQIIKEAAGRPEMSVIAQSAGFWAIRTIAEQRQKSTKRAADQRSARSKKRLVENQVEVNGADEPDPLEMQKKPERATTLEPIAIQEDTDPIISSAEVENKKIMSAKGKRVSMTEPAVDVVADIEPYQNDRSSTESSSDDDEIRPARADSEDKLITQKGNDEQANNLKLLLGTLSPETLHRLVSESITGGKKEQHEPKEDEDVAEGVTSPHKTTKKESKCRKRVLKNKNTSPGTENRNPTNKKAQKGRKKRARLN